MSPLIGGCDAGAFSPLLAEWLCILRVCWPPELGGGNGEAAPLKMLLSWCLSCRTRYSDFLYCLCFLGPKTSSTHSAKLSNLSLPIHRQPLLTCLISKMASEPSHPTIAAGDHKGYMEYALEQARLLPPAPTKFAWEQSLSMQIRTKSYRLDIRWNCRGIHLQIQGIHMQSSAASSKWLKSTIFQSVK